MRSIASSLSLVSTDNDTKQINGSLNSGKSLLESLIIQLEGHHNQVIKDALSYKPLDSPLQGPDRSRLSLYVDQGKVILAMLKGLLSLHSHQKTDELEKARQMYASSVQRIVLKPIPKELIKEDFLEDILNVIEVRTNCFNYD